MNTTPFRAHPQTNPRNMMIELLSWGSNEAKVTTAVVPHSFPHVNSSALERAQVIHANPSLQHPSFLKQLLKSHLSGKFYLGLPKKFCDAHLPGQDARILLVDENGKEYNTKYSVRKNRLSGGWRGFSAAHKLLEGDALVFHLIEPCKFRVYIVRSSKLTENDGAADFQTYHFPNNKTIGRVKIEDQTNENPCSGKKAKQTYLNLPAVEKRPRLKSDSKQQMNQSQGIRSSESIIFFKDVKGFEDFKIQLDGLILDSEIPKHVKVKYYNLCGSQKMFLHDRLIKGLSSKLALVMISETTEIADAIRSANLATSPHDLECWVKTLKAFEDLGMVVGFLRDRLHKLISLSRESLATLESKRIKIAQAHEEITILEAASLNAKALIVNLEGEIETLNLKIEKLGFEFQVLARAPW